MAIIDKIMLLFVVASSMFAADAMYNTYGSHYPTSSYYPTNAYSPYASVPQQQQSYHNPNAYHSYGYNRYPQTGYVSQQPQTSGPYFYNGYQYAQQYPVQNYQHQNTYYPNTVRSPVPNNYQNGAPYYSSNQNQPTQYQSHQSPYQGSTYTQNQVNSPNGVQPAVISAGSTYVEPSPKTPVTECIMADQYKEVCGYYGITEDECRSENCCWDSRATAGSSIPWCYKQIMTQDNIQPPAASNANVPAPLSQQTTQERLLCLESSPRLRESCIELGCCYDATDNMCYYKQENTDICPEAQVKKANQCRLPQGPVQLCVSYQISSRDCLAMGCCYGMMDSEPICYKSEERYENQQELIEPLSGVSLPGSQAKPAPTAAAKLNILNMLKEMDKNIKPTEKVNLLSLLKNMEGGKEVVPKTARPEADVGPKKRPKVIPPPTLPPAIPQFQCDPRGRGCRYVTPQQPMCYPQKCGSPTFTPSKIPNKFDPKKIVGGTRAFPFSHPWTVMIQKMEGNKTFICGGTLICSQWLITAAHCLDQQTGFKNTPDLDPDMYKIFLGRYTGWKLKPGRQVQVFKGKADIAIMYQHEKFQPGKHRGVITHDIALIKLRKRVITDDYVQPACLPQESAQAGKVLFATGWGVTRRRGPNASTLKQVGVQVRKEQACKDRVPGYGNPLGVICAGGEQWHDTCTGDSGGPLVGSKAPQRQNRGGGLSSLFGGGSRQPQGPRWFVYGLTSIGSPSCNTLRFDRQPAIYTDVFFYLNWIKKYTQHCCG